MYKELPKLKYLLAQLVKLNLNVNTQIHPFFDHNTTFLKTSHMRSLLCCLLIILLLGCVKRNIETITVKGSDTEVNLVLQLAEAYMETDPTVSINVTGGGSGVGIAGLLNGRLDVANSSREINKYEQLLAVERNVDLEYFIFAADAIAIICHQAVPIDSLSLEDLGKIFSGEIQNWQQLGGPNGSISRYGRQSNSGTFTYFRERVLGKDYSPNVMQMNGNAQILEAVKATPNAIGYIGFGYLTDEMGALRHGIKVIKISTGLGKAAVSPLNRAAIKAALYPLTRPLFQFTNGKPTGKTLAFYNFEKSPAGQNIIAQNGYLPTSEAGLDLNLWK